MKTIFLLLMIFAGSHFMNAQDSSGRDAVAKPNTLTENQTATFNSVNADQSKRSQTNSVKKDTLTNETNGELREQKKSKPKLSESGSEK